jgi:radical SAM-linked protein
MQRLRITFSRSEELKYITHLDLMRLWQRVLRRADIPLVYSQGFSPHPRISLAAPLAIGVTSSSELMDIYLERRLSPHFFIKSVKEQLPRGIDILEVAEVGVGLPSLQSQIRFAEYKVVIEVDKKPKEVESAINSLLSSDSLPWQHTRDKEIRKYDLRALIEDIWLIESRSPEFVIGMRLRCDSAGTGRPEQVVSALGFANPPKSIHRTELILEKQVKSAALR